MGFLLPKAQHFQKCLILLLAASFAYFLSEPYSPINLPSLLLVKLIMTFQYLVSSARKSTLIRNYHDHKRVLLS